MVDLLDNLHTQEGKKQTCCKNTHQITQHNFLFLTRECKASILCSELECKASILCSELECKASILCSELCANVQWLFLFVDVSYVVKFSNNSVPSR